MAEDSERDVEEVRNKQRDKEIEEQLEKEKQTAFKRYGVRDTELNIATRVACDLAKGIKNDLVDRWIAHHNKMDEERRRNEAKYKLEVQLKKEIEQYSTVRRKELEEAYGL